MIPRNAALLSIVLVASGCAGTPEAGSGGPQAIEGTVHSIDTTPWAYDGNAVVEVDTHAQGRVAIQLPARWNLCAAPPVDVAALAVGMQVRARGAAGPDRTLTVCQDANHHLTPAD